MRSVAINFERPPYLNKEAIDYLADKNELHYFRKYSPDLNSIPEVLAARSGFPTEARTTLSEQLNLQYDTIGIKQDDPIRKQIDALMSPETFTITTGQQLHIGLGPLFFIYKILSCIDTADELNQKYPEYHFVPVFWMASEDHDFEEINYVKLYGQTFSWDDDQGGPVGRYSTASLAPVLRELRERLDKTAENEQMMDILDEVYQNQPTLARATHALVHQLFGHRGLLVLDPDNTPLKKEFTSAIRKDLLDGVNYEPLDVYSKKLKDQGYDLQINPQETNHFLLQEGKRSKIRKVENGFELDSGENLSPEQMSALINDHPEIFSPNVVMRPVYQETILPNLIYVPGGSELRYWLQLKGVFETNDVPFPLVLPRSSAVVISEATFEQIESLGSSLPDLFLSEHELARKSGDKDTNPVQSIERKLEKMLSQIRSLPPDLQRIAPQEKPPLKYIGGADKNIAAIRQWLQALPPEIRNSDPYFKKLLKIKRRFFDTAFPQERGDFCINYSAFVFKLTIGNAALRMFKDCRNLNVWVTKSI